MNIKFVSFLFLWSFSLIGHGQSNFPKPVFSTILDTSIGKILLQQCSRQTPTTITACWKTGQNDVYSLEAHFSDLDTLKTTGCCQGNAGRIPAKKRYAVQYLGVVIHQRKYIYVNAFDAAMLDLLKNNNTGLDPVKQPVRLCDGGDNFWGALFDIESKTFSQLNFNGEG